MRRYFDNSDVHALKVGNRAGGASSAHFRTLISESRREQDAKLRTPSASSPLLARPTPSERFMSTLHNHHFVGAGSRTQLLPAAGPRSRGSWRGGPVRFRGDQSGDDGHKPAVPIARARSIHCVSCTPLQLQILQCCARRNSAGGASDVDHCSMLQQVRVRRAEDAPAPAEAVAFIIYDAAFLSMQLCDERSRSIHLASVGHCNK